MKQIFAFYLICLSFLTHRINAQCSGGTLNITANTPSGGFSKLGYTDNEDCYWLIHVPIAYDFMYIYFPSFETEGCCDFVSIYNGPSTNSPNIGTRSGGSAATIIVQNPTDVLIHFYSDGSVLGRGFELAYELQNGSFASCPTNQNVSSKSGWIGRFPSYANNEICSWVITPPVGYDYMAFTFYLLQTESTYDFVRLYNGNSNSGNIFGSYSGTINGFQPFTNTQANVTFVEFTADFSNTGQGFILFFDSFTGVPSVTTGTITTGTVTTGSITTGAVTTGTLPDTCGGTLTAVAGTFGNLDYSNNQRCVWNINPPAGYDYIEFIIGDLQTEDSWDVLTFYNGPTIDSYIIERISGYYNDYYLYTSQSSALVIFTSDASTTDYGFTVNYVARRGVSPFLQACLYPNIVGSSGSFGDGSQGVNYPPDYSCSYYVSASAPNTLGVEVGFTAFNTQLNHDNVTLSSVYQTFILSGSNVTGRVFEFNSTNVNFDFVSDDDNITAQGWTAVYVTKRSTLCGSQLLMEDKGTIELTEYTAFTNCRFLIAPKLTLAKKYIEIKVHNVNLTTGDSFRIFDGDSDASDQLALITGTCRTPTNCDASHWTTQANYAVIAFQSYSDGIGFRLSYAVTSSNTTSVIPSEVPEESSTGFGTVIYVSFYLLALLVVFV